MSHLSNWMPGILAGAAAAVVASLVSLPLESPDDVIFNTATVTAGCLVLGVAAAAGWAALGDRPQRLALFLGLCAALFGVAVVVALLFETQLERSLEFMLPLAAIAVAMIAVLTPLLARVELRPPYPAASTAAGVIIALGLGIALAGQGDEESGRLELPEAPSDAGAPPRVISRDDVEGVAFEVQSGESTLTYTVREKLANLPAESDAVGRTSAITGTVHLDGRESRVEADMSTLRSNQDRRDNFVRTNIFNTDPIVEFVVTDLGELPEEYRAGEVVTRELIGRATVRGVTRPLTFAVEARMDGDVLNVLGRTDFTWDDFEIPPPNIGGIVQVQDNVHIEVLIVARRSAASGAREASTGACVVTPLPFETPPRSTVQTEVARSTLIVVGEVGEIAGREPIETSDPARPPVHATWATRRTVTVERYVKGGPVRLTALSCKKSTATTFRQGARCCS